MTKNEEGEWLKQEDILPSNDICVGNWNSGISPDGKTVIWLRNYTKDNIIQYSEFWITKKKKIDGQRHKFLFQRIHLD